MEIFDSGEGSNRLIMGEIEEDKYVLTQIKHMQTQSVIGRERLQAICDYLKRELESGEQEHFITINDQLPLRVTNMEMRQLLIELKEIKERLN